MSDQPRPKKVKKPPFEERIILDSPPLSAKQVRAFRQDLGLSQKEFAKEFNVPLVEVIKWEINGMPPQRTGVEVQVEASVDEVENSIDGARELIGRIRQNTGRKK